MIFSSRRNRGGPDVWLPLKTALFIVGAAAAVAGMVLDRDWLITAAIVLLGIGFLLRFVTPREDSADPEA
jgi:hypothetical protein